jgi:hypothetical protein
MKQVSTLKELLKETEVTFTYTKKNGETRKAIGTLNLDPSIAIGMTEAFMPKSNRSIPNVVNYWDVEKMAWRSFNENQLVSVEGLV